MAIRLENTKFNYSSDEHRFKFRIEPDILGEGVEIAVLVPVTDAGLEVQWDLAYERLLELLEGATKDVRCLCAERRERAEARELAHT